MGLNFLQAKSRIFCAADPYEVSAYVNSHVGSHGLSISSEHHSAAELNHRKAGNLDLCRVSYGAQARVVSPGLPDIYHVQFILRGHCRYEVARSALDLPAGHVFLINPDEPLDLTYSDDCEKFIVKIPAVLFAEACTENHWFKPNDRIRFKPTPYRFEELDSLIMLMTLLCQEAESESTTPQMLQHYNRVVTSKLMTLLKHNVCLEAPSSQCPGFDRLVRYIDENIKRDITAEELARHSHLSLRSLYLLFEKHAETTPKNYIRRKKLEHVYARLNDPASKVANVTALALDYGFNHLGRFSELYKSAYGVLPSEALRERQARR